MKSPQRFLALAATLSVAVLLAACAKTASPGAATSSSAPPASSTPATQPAGVTVKTASVTGVGTVLVDSTGRTLYELSADQGGKVTCTSSSCTSAWPPLLVPDASSVHAGSGVNASMLGTVKTPSGQLQVMYNHWPLYRFSGDSGPDQANGQDIHSFGGVWHPLDAAGKPATSSGSTTSSSTSGYGY